MAEEARLESVYASKAHPGFESPSLRKRRTLFAFFLWNKTLTFNKLAFFLLLK